MDDRQRVIDLVDELLAVHASDPQEKFWGAQFDKGLAWVNFPEGHGGLGLDAGLQDLIQERLASAGAPSNRLRNFMGVGMAGPTLVAHGTEELRQRHLRPLFTCEEIWCQLFSEPGAGSDLASLSTRAVRDADGWIVNGQKVWTTMAHIARWGLLLARTDPELPKHEGLTYFIVDMHADGVDVRPLRQMTGEAEFNEVYFDNVFIPDTQRIGEVGAGWRVAITTLMNERAAISGLGKPPRGSGMISHAVQLWQQREDKDAGRRDDLMKLWIRAENLRLTTLRATERIRRGEPGPEGSVGKLEVGLTNQAISNFCMDLRGMGALEIGTYEAIVPEIMGGEVLTGAQDVDLTNAFLVFRGTTIGGGTSSITRNVIGERVLGLPGEPRIDKDLPWSQVPRS